MANQKQLDRVLKQGVQAWNKWRAENFDEYIDLSNVNLNNADLSGIDLSNADLSNADLIRAHLSNADLSGACLNHAVLIEADLSDATLIEADLNSAILSRANLHSANLNSADFSDSNLNSADLHGVNLTWANIGNAHLVEANLSEAILITVNLRGATLNRANLRNAHLHRVNLDDADLRLADLRSAHLYNVYLDDANLSDACLQSTSFGDVDLSAVKGLETVKHSGPSSIGIDTIYRSQGNIPEVFLKEAGVPDMFLDYIHSLISKPIDYYSCFISYSSKDEALAKRLHDDLQSNHVRCWFAPEDLKWGERIRTGIDEAIHQHDKLLIVLSKSSVASGWVEREVKTALAKERKEKRTVLFPVRVDNAVFESPFDWATEIRHERNIGDFTRWKDHDAYQKAFSRLLRDLKSEAMTG